MRSERSRLLPVAALCLVLAGCGGSKKVAAPAPPPPSPAVLLDINGATQPSGPIGSTVILEGQHFYSMSASSQVLFSGTGTSVPALVLSGSDWTDTYIVTTVPAGATSGPVRVVTAVDTSNAISFAVTSSPAFSPSAISWSATTSLPLAVSGHAAAFATLRSTDTSRVVFSIGGIDSTRTLRSEVYHASVLASGQLGSWIPGTPLPSPLAFHAAVIATPGNSRYTGTGELYVIGGATNASGSPTSSVYRCDLGADGVMSAWTPAATLPVAVHSAGAVIFHGDLYVVGGSGSGNTPTGGVYRSRIGSDGTLGAWVSEPSLPPARSYHAVGEFGGCVYAFGGDSASVTPNDSLNASAEISQVAYAKVNLPTGDLISWNVNGSGLTKSVCKHTAVAAGGYVLVTGGLYNGATTGSTEETYAQFQADGSVASFNGATGSHTIASAGGGNLFNHAALEYVDTNGTSHVIVLGGDDVNQPGHKHAEVWVY